MSTKRPFFNGSTYAVNDEASDFNDSQTLNQSRRPFLDFTETSNKMDVSPEMGMEVFQPFKRKHKEFFHTESTSHPKGKRPFLSYTTDDDLCDNGNSVKGGEKDTSRRPFLIENLSWQEETSSCDTHKPFNPNDSVMEAMTLLTEMADNELSPDEAAKILQEAAKKLTSDSSHSQTADNSEKSKSAGNSDNVSGNKNKPAAKGKETITAAWVKDQILQKVPMIRHAGGLYAYNGRTYVAITEANQLVGIVINQVDEKMFGLTSTYIFDSVLTTLQVDDRLIPKDYTDRVIDSEDIVVFKNTLLNVRTLKKIPFNPWYITSYEIDANYIAHPEPDVFLDFLHSTSGGDSEIEDCITDCISYILAGTNQGKIFFVLGTAQDSGKSSLATFLQALFHEKYIFNIAPNEFKDKFALGGNRGRILNISMDLPSTKLNSDVVATIKKITGGDRIMSQEKNEKKEFGVSSMRLLFGTNHAISVNPSDDNDAFWNRLQVIPFTQTIAPEDKDPHLAQKLLDERDDIVSYCIQKMPDIIERGYKLSPCQAAEDIKEEWRYGIPDADSLESFCDTFVEFTGNKEDVVLATDIYKHYKEFCKTIGVKPLRDEKIKEWFVNHGGECDRGRLPGMKNAQSLIFGIRLAEDIN